MSLLLIFSITLLVAVFLSDFADRSIISTAVLFLVAGFCVGEGSLGLVSLEPTDPFVSALAVLALFSTLFTDGMRIGVKELREAWRLPGRAILLGMPLAFGLSVLLAHGMLGMDWIHALLISAILAPTDPVFAAAIVGREEVPKALRRLLNVESGLNDGLALPVVIVMLALVSHDAVHAGTMLTELAAGVMLGVAIPWMAIRIESLKWFNASMEYEPLHAFAIGLVLFAVCLTTHSNEFLAAFAAGITIATVGPKIRESFHRFGELVAELLKLAALLVFGCLMSWEFLREVPWQGYLFAALTLVVVRPLALMLALLRSELNWRERAAAAWFGPKGFASVVYGILVLKSGVEGAEDMFHLVAIVIAASILLHSSTDVLVAEMFADNKSAAEPTAG